jgi:gluconokinase
MVIIIMGVSGSGKTTIGSQLADQLDWPFYEGDDYHPPENIAKMSSGIALTDDDRKPWLEALANLIADLLAKNVSAVLACSALKSIYREQLKRASRSPVNQVRFVYLRISPEVARERLQNRKGHFMPANLVSSQFEALEEPGDAIIINAALSPDEAAAQVRQALEL